MDSSDKTIRAIKKKMERIMRVIQEKQAEYDQLQRELEQAYAQKNKESLGVLSTQIRESHIELTQDDVSALMDFLKNRKQADEQEAQSPAGDVAASKKETAKVSLHKEEKTTPEKLEKNEADAKSAEKNSAADAADDQENPSEKDSESPRSQSVDVSVSTPYGVQNEPFKPKESNNAPLIKEWAPNEENVFHG
jgi:hypothetical protein